MATDDDPSRLHDIYHALTHGGGRERVDDGNVGALIEMAHQRGNSQLELLLREWRSPCGDDPEMPTPEPTLPPPNSTGHF